MSTERPMNKKALKRKLNRQFQKTETRKIKVDNYLRILNQSYPNDYVSSSSDESALISNYSFEQIFEEQTESEVGVVDDAQSSGSANVSEEELGENIREINESDSDEFNEFHQNNSDEDGNDDDDDNAIAFIDDHERGLYVYETIRQWALQGGCLSMTKLDALLTQLHSVFPEVPRSYKTLLATPKHLDVIELEDNNQMWYKSVGANLDSMNLQEYLQRFNKITIDVNVDGLPLSKSSKQKFWPILGKLVGSKNEPFIIAVHHGNSDPKVNEFLMDFVLEIQDLSENGYIYNNHIYEFIVRHYICDAPARALIKGIIEHGGYYACEKCTVVGEWIQNRMTYLQLDQSLRTDESFTNREQPFHHQVESPLEVIPTGMISQFRLDVLHLVHFGVFKRLLLAWMKWNGPWKLHHTAVNAITVALQAIETSCPTDFNRKPREFNLAHYKATEFRRILLYDGIVIFKNNILNNVYKHFLLLHCGLYILSSPILVQSHLDYANKLLKLFITHSAVIFGDKFVVYNVHSLCHLVQECAEHGNVESFSTYPFENKLKSIKSLLQSGYKPLHQVAYRDLERNCNVDIVLEDNNHIQLSMRHFLPEDNVEGSQFRCVSVNGIVLKVNKKDSCFKTKTGEVVCLQNIILQDRQVILVGFSFKYYADVYKYPLRSSILGIVKVSNLEKRKVFFHLEQVEAKCWLIPDGNSYVCVPLVHIQSMFP